MDSPNEVPSDERHLEDAIGKLSRALESYGLSIRGELGDILGIEDNMTCLQSLRDLAEENGLFVRQIIGSEIEALLDKKSN